MHKIIWVNTSLVLPSLPAESDFQTLFQLRFQSPNITRMGLSISTLLFTQFLYQPRVKFNNVVQSYKCQSVGISLDDESDLFMSAEENLVILSTPNALIVNIEESDFWIYLHSFVWSWKLNLQPYILCLHIVIVIHHKLSKFWFCIQHGRPTSQFRFQLLRPGKNPTINCWTCPFSPAMFRT